MNKKGLNICLVDDDRIYQFTARKIIETIEEVDGVKVFSNGEEAISYLQQNSYKTEDLPDVIFLDINMPVMDGWGFLEAFSDLYKKLGKLVTVFMVSSSVDESDIRRSKEFGMVSRYVNKPVSREKFEDLLKTITDTHKQQ
ncbi:response regulator [Segetibacter sp. 3557_3]|uniref:response regulator n=1 Tax=Segetibacter sp. 3557_3 TaxID=2547429 RepID=UPI001058E9FC|nr:response regulator [Segetibacter sp. 3557_3]TDH25225.1 response regulator [Segetibacter sp. 3557_3]